ncbi:FAD-dependent oxidoreductase [Rhodococcus koreensis]|uniref:FAD-dependent oxidoreductase n=1 Tax=Rhodococcus koreensis TaxID=99653 RepID=UPI00366DE472
MTKQVVIIGGGIAGPVTAMAMQKAGLDPVVYEACGHGADGVGAFLTLAPNGLEALHLLDLDRHVTGLGMGTRRMRIVSGTGKRLAEFDNGGLTSFGTPSRTLRRADLYRTLRDEALRRGIRIEYGKQLRDARQRDDRVHADFADGTSADGDLLVGADGLWSRTRTLLDPQAPTPRYLGLLNTGGFATGLALDGEPGAAHFHFGKRCFFGYLIHPDGDVWWFANPGRRTEPSAGELASITPEQQRAELTELFSRDAGPALQIIDATEHIIRSWSTYDLPTVPTWRNERMVIIGDAAHATSPSSGQGASMAIEDAVVLARCLREHRDTAVALAAYETARRTRVERIVAQGKRNGSGKAPGPVGRAIRDVTLPTVMRMIGRRDSLRWMYDYRLEW